MASPDGSAVVDSGMPEMQPDDFAAAEAEAADLIAIDETAPEATSETEADATAGEAPVEGDPNTAGPWPPAAEAIPAPNAGRTQVAVVGLVSVASIATFKRLLGRVPGVRGVQVASGPDGEFLFSASHDTAVDMAAAVAGIQGFEVQVTESGPGIVSAHAVDPEAV